MMTVMTRLTKGKWGLAINASLKDWVLLGHARYLQGDLHRAADTSSRQ